jgi:AraC-like DNA-binding protein
VVGAFPLLAPRPPASPLSEPVISALAYLDETLDDPPRLVQAARAAHISPSRLTHLFTEQVGIPFRRFVLWLRLRRAAEYVWRTRSLTEAAHAAGFSDLAHFSRVCRATFGVAPTGLLAMAPITASWSPASSTTGGAAATQASSLNPRGLRIITSSKWWVLRILRDLSRSDLDTGRAIQIKRILLEHGAFPQRRKRRVPAYGL